ncbi:MAG: translation elongation factor-like protein [Candidatus Omnitrophica bacterium]|nr:translation elongation factor-like protein [Candidatus Omnitrophota bacterium]MBI2173812.1 translation elongation factor-like protein [Candidatus Omnitrophota bacterium]MBI3009792.1 translation elongation factor-like protein [Candidatus Omnitrophota bacterium]
MPEKAIGRISHYYGHISVGIIELTDGLKVGDSIHIKGHATDFTQSVDSMQVEHVNVQEAKAGDSVGIKIAQKVHPHDTLYKVVN